ncbi:MAG: PKD domain-containing protein, partial [Myxococcota bacterium]
MSGGELDVAISFTEDNGAPFVSERFATSLKFGPDGALYYTSSGPDESLGDFYEVGRIRFIGVEAPTANFTTSPSPPSGLAPLPVAFTDTSTDNGTIQQRQWNFGDGASSTEVNPTHIYQSPGHYMVELTVTDNEGLVDTAQAVVQVNFQVTLELRGEVLDGNRLDRQLRSGTTELRLYDAEGAPVSFEGGVGPDSNGIAAADGVIDTNVDLQLSSRYVVVKAGEASDDLAAQSYAFEVSTSTTVHRQVVTLAPSRTAIGGQVKDAEGNATLVDLGIAREQASTLYAFVTGRDYLPGSGIDLTEIPHRLTTDMLGNFYFPLRDPGTYFVDIVGDTGAETYRA